MIYMIRHGQTALNVARVLQGRRDEPLNDTGREQARTAAAWFRASGISFDRVISSPLCRALETAQILSGGAAVETDARLMEIDCGPWEGAELRDPPPALGAFFRDLAHVPPPEGMESLESVVARTGAFLRELAERIGPAETVLIATHAIALKGVLENLAPKPDGGWWGWPVHNCCGYVFALKDGALF